jgi:hypothetical protein
MIALTHKHEDTNREQKAWSVVPSPRGRGLGRGEPPPLNPLPMGGETLLHKYMSSYYIIIMQIYNPPLIEGKPKY